MLIALEMMLVTVRSGQTLVEGFDMHWHFNKTRQLKDISLGSIQVRIWERNRISSRGMFKPVQGSHSWL
jgi:hypothetical protein